MLWGTAAAVVPATVVSASHHNAPNNLPAQATVFRAVNGRPDDNMRQVFELQGGIERVVGADDVVVIKPNVQWWNQGAPNLAALNALVEMIMARPGGFSGEVVIAENCHRGARPWDSNAAGWKHPFTRNADLPGVASYNDLGAVLKKKFSDRFSICHWINVGDGGRRVCSPADGPGYVFCDGTGGVPRLAFGNGLTGADFRETIMTYPIFRTDRGTVVDFKNGVWAGGGYGSRPLSFINLAALNHHSTYCGITSAVKNYLGVSDLSGGPDPFDGGKLDSVHYNFHSLPFNKWAPGPAPGMIGAEIGVFLSTVRRPTLNIVTAEWIGLSSRTDGPVVRTRAVLACSDPVALDYHCAKYLLFPNSGIRFHDPDATGSPTRQYLESCARHGGGIYDKRRVEVVSHDLQATRPQRDSEMVILAEKEWGREPRSLAKYFLMRYGGFLL